MKRIIFVWSLWAVLLAGTSAFINAQQRVIIFDPLQRIHYADANDKSVRALPVSERVWMIVGAGANIAVQLGEDGVLIVDTGSGGAMTDKVQNLVRQLSPRPIRYILNTNYLADHTSGNEALRGIPPGGPAGGGRGGGGRGTPIASHENVLARLSAPTGKVSPTPANAWPTETYYTAFHDIYFNGEGIQMLHEPHAVTDGDSIVYFRRSDVIVTGDIFQTTTYPFIDTKSGGTINGVINGLNRILQITIPKEKQEGGTMVIPGHGRICDEADVLEYRDMLTIIRDRIQDAIKKGKTLQQVQSAGLTKDYDGRYGVTAGPWTTAMFIEAVYQSLSKKP
jgi:glyoxylase-like metal-dependent hydrolase (beta-lactamase superfamily II)